MSEAQIPPVDDGFGKIVLDLVKEWDHEQGERYELLVQQILDAYTPRISAARKRAADAERNAAAYAAMDRAQREVMKGVRAVIGQLSMTNAAHVARLDSLARFRGGVHDLLRALQTDGTLGDTAVMAAGLEQLLEEMPERRPAERVIQLGIAVDSRFSVGIFHNAEEHDVLMPFVGWTMEVNPRFEFSGLEATFLRADGHTATRGELMAIGLKFIRLA